MKCLVQHRAVRGDASAEDIRIRVSGDPVDLHAADAHYHKDYHKLFFSERNTKAAQSATVLQISYVTAWPGDSGGR